MIERRTLVMLLLAIVMFCVGGYVGYRARQWWDSQKQLAQPGWCCMPDRRACVVSPGADACRGAGGATFNWDRAICSRLCYQDAQ